MKDRTGMRTTSRGTRLSLALRRARGVPIEDDIHAYLRVVHEVRAIDHSRKTDAEIRSAAGAMRARAAADGNMDRELNECFALAAEACRRRLRLPPFDEQLAAGVVMHQGKLAQMQTGEGKTLAAVFPACLNAMTGRGVHVMTANDYLARRDARWMGPVYEMMGFSVAAIGAGSTPAERRAAYRADVTYLPAREAGFDFLRDGMCGDPGDVVQREPAMALVDEADFILIDEARVPLVIAGAAESDGIDVRRVDAVAASLRRDLDFTVEREGRRVTILPAGHRRIEAALGVEGIHEERGAACFARVHAALHARTLLQRDVDYVVKEGRIALVDGFTGRIAETREWPWGVQAALEAREGLEIRPEGTVYGSITTQGFISLYPKIAAMTATAVPSAEELQELYGLAVVITPTVKPCRRIDEPDRVFATTAEKRAALVSDIAAAHAAGRPVLVGTGSVRESQELSEDLRASGILCEVLNARNDEKEAQLIALAGRRDALTISTNMAGRGVDIKLGDETVHSLGGLLVIGTNRHECRRIDDQLRGRAGRQGEPGSSRFYVSLEDPLFVRFGVPEFLPRGCALDDPRVLREIDRAQSIIEAQNHAIRRALRKYSRLVELDRRTVRALRDGALRDGTLPGRLEEACPSEDARPRLTTAFLCLLDAFWAEHLLLVEEVREGIDLERFAGREPALQYIHRIGKAFEAGLEGIEEKLLDACARYAGDPEALSLRSMGVSRPSSTWTYQVDDEAPLRFSLSLIGGSEIAAGIAAAPSLILGAGLGLLTAATVWLESLFRGRRPPPSRGCSTDYRGGPSRAP